MGRNPRTAIWWVRRDLRLYDNQALSQALANADQVIPTFVIDHHLVRSNRTAGKRLAFLWDGLRSLDADLRQRGSRLVVREGDAVEELARLRQETEAVAVFAEEDGSPYAQRRDGRVAERLPLALCPGITFQHAAAVRKPDGRPYTVYTPYCRAWRALPSAEPGAMLAAPHSLATMPDLPSLTIPGSPGAAAFPAGEGEARRRLTAFAMGPDAPIYRYALERDRMDLVGTSGLSPYVRFGMLSARQAVAAASAAIRSAPTREARRSAEIFLGELIWREFYSAILYHFPRVARESFRPELQGITWDDDPHSIEAWETGRTGYPIVDAAMRQLRQTGWMHNRARMISASFLVKDLLADWRLGEAYFRQELIDADLASNNGGWQWTAGTGADAAPYFRIFNPVIQGEKFDPQGDYVRRWVPELAGVPPAYAHRPWDMPEETQRAARCRIGKDYPGPIVDHGWARGRALAAYGVARQRAASRKPGSRGARR